jgi:K+-sensing histidine kinase KdpD
MGAPLIHHGEFLGELDLDSPQPNIFGEDDAELLLALASQVASMLYNARQYEDELERAKRFQALNEVSQAISHLDLDAVLDVVYRRLSSLMDTTTFFIGLYDEEAGIIRLVGAYDHGKRSKDEVQNAADGMSGLVLRTREKVIILDTEQEVFPQETIIQDEQPRSVLMVPLITQDEVVGIISVQSYKPNAYTHDDIEMLETMAGAVATAIRNAQLYDQTADRLAVLETLHQMSLELASVQELDQVVEMTVKAVLELFHPGQVRLFLVNEPPESASLWIGQGKAESLRLRRYDYGIADTIIEQVRQSGQSVLIHGMDPQMQSEFGTAWLVQAVVAYPLQRGDQLLGVLELLHAEPHFFRRDTVRALELLSMQAATALQNARYYDSLRRRLHEVGMLQELARKVSGSRDLDDILHLVVSTLRDVYQCRSASLALYDSETDMVITRASVGLEQDYVEMARFRRGEFVAGQVVATGEGVYVPDTQTFPGFRVIDPGVRSLMSVPLTIQDRVIGALNIDSEYPNAFTPDHERVLSIAGGQIAAVIEMVRLLDEAHDRATQLADANAELEALDHLRTELVQNVSHELRSPLALVRGYAGLLRDGELGPVTSDQMDALSIINEKAEAITRLINDILSLEQIRADTIEPSMVEINEFAQHAVMGARMLYPQRQFIADLASGEYLVNADKGRLDQVFNNLIGNAAKFTPEDSTITVRTFHNMIEDRIEISVIDQGIGIAPERLPHIFERFYQGDRTIHHKYGGVGLGLSIVKRIVEAHGGEVWATSQAGIGTTLTFTLPLAREDDGA